MNSKLIFLNYFLTAILSTTGINAQERVSLKQYEDSIQASIKQLIAERTDEGRLALNKKVIGYFDNALALRESFDYPFDSLKNISKLMASDSLVRVISWNLPKRNGDYIYYAYIQQLNKNKKKLKLFKLIDASAEIENPEFEKLGPEKWYGALYYRIETNTSSKSTYYTLLGWDGNTNFTNKKLIECFFFEGKKLVLGPPIFKMEKGIKNRLVFEYAKQAKMMLRYDEKMKMIVYDHLAPSHKKFTGQYMYYGPDMSQDGIQFIEGYWVIKPNLDLRNMEESTGKSIKKSF